MRTSPAAIAVGFAVALTARHAIHWYRHAFAGCRRAPLWQPGLLRA